MPNEEPTLRNCFTAQLVVIAGTMAKLTFLQINDLHGYITPHPEMVRDPSGDWRFTELGGLARIANLFRSVREGDSDAVIALDNGDTFHGTHVAVSSNGAALVPMLNSLSLDAMTVHWEFAYGPAGVKALESALAYPVLAVNCFSKLDDTLVFPPYRMLERAGMRIAVIGIACPIVDKTMPPQFSEGIYFTIGEAEVKKWISHCREMERAELIVVLSHLGFPQDIKLASNVEGIDVLASGHTHNRMDKPIVVNGAIIFQSGCHGSFVGRLDAEVSRGKIASYTHELVAMDSSLGEDVHMARLVHEALSGEAELSEIIGSVTEPLHRYAMLNSPMDDVLLEAVAKVAGTKIAFSNGWRYGAPIPPGPVTRNDLWNIIPTNPAVSTIDLTGKEIHDMLEQNLEKTFAADPYEQMGGFVKRMRGIRMYFKAENPNGHRIDRLFIENSIVDMDRIYAVAFVTEQGVPNRFGRNRRKLKTCAVDALVALFKERKRVTPSSVQSVFEI